jgi:hypothetical protein
MKLRVAVDALLLRLAVPAKRLRVAVAAAKLILSVPAMRLQTAIGLFVAFLRPTETVSSTDAAVAFVGKSVADAAGASVHRFESEVRKPLAHGVGFDDGSPYFLEDYVAGAPFNQTYTLPLQVFKNIFKPRADAVGVANAGLLVIQDYTETMTYFAEDYVGTSRSF